MKTKMKQKYKVPSGKKNQIPSFWIGISKCYTIIFSDYFMGKLKCSGADILAGENRAGSKTSVLGVCCEHLHFPTLYLKPTWVKENTSVIPAAGHLSCLYKLSIEGEKGIWGNPPARSSPWVMVQKLCWQLPICSPDKTTRTPTSGTLDSLLKRVLVSRLQNSYGTGKVPNDTKWLWCQDLNSHFDVPLNFHLNLTTFLFVSFFFSG